MGRTIAQYVHFKTLCNFWPSSKQNNNVEPPKFALSENRNFLDNLFNVPFSTQHCSLTLCRSCDVPLLEKINASSR